MMALVSEPLPAAPKKFTEEEKKMNTIENEILFRGGRGGSTASARVGRGRGAKKKTEGSGRVKRRAAAKTAPASKKPTKPPKKKLSAKAAAARSALGAVFGAAKKTKKK